MTKAEIVAYLDDAIRRWRTVRDSDLEEFASLKEMAPQYIDAYQAVRVAITGRVLE